MSDNNNYENNNYTPNFVMHDPEEQQIVKADHVGGTYYDPRQGFNGRYAGGSAEGGSAAWSNGRSHSSSGYDNSNMNRGPRKPKKASPVVNLTRKGLALLIVGCMVISGAFGLGGAFIGTNLALDNSSSPAPVETHTSGYNLEDATGSNMTIQEITAKAQTSVVEIRTEGVMSDSWMQQYVTQGAGSGVIISEDGYIITNNHVIDNASRITVTTKDKKDYEATLIGTDSISDIAVIKIEATGLTPAVYGNSDQLQVGDMAVAIGNPLGQLGGTVTAGIISAKDRELNIDGKSMSLLQTDSSINPGNSGGGLFNGDGQLIGIVVAKSSGSDVEGLGFAIPINTAADKAQQLIDNGYVSGQPWTGMTYTEASSGFDSMFGTSAGSVYIYSVDTAESRAAGFLPGDLVFAVAGQQITSIDDLSAVITSHAVGDVLKFTIVRDGQTHDIKLKLQEKTKDISSN